MLANIIDFRACRTFFVLKTITFKVLKWHLENLAVHNSKTQA